MYSKMGRMGSAELDLFRIEVMIEGPTIFVFLHREEGRWPFRIDNFSNVNVSVYQVQCKPRYTIPKGKQMPYAWDSPSEELKLLTINVNGKEREVNISEIGPTLPFKYSVSIH